MPAERVLDDARMELYDDDVARLAPGELSGVYGVRIEAIAVAGTARQPNLLALRPRERGLEAPLLVRVVLQGRPGTLFGKLSQPTRVFKPRVSYVALVRSDILFVNSRIYV